MVQLSHKEGAVDLSHRFMLEQRFVGRYSSENETTEDEFPLLNRFRYMIRLQTPLIGNEIKDDIPYVVLYDEIFVGFGENVQANISAATSLWIKKLVQADGAPRRTIIKVWQPIYNEYYWFKITNRILNYWLSLFQVKEELHSSKNLVEVK